MENEIGEKVAMAQASAELTDLGANLNAQQRKFAEFLQPKTYRQHQPHLDEELAYKIVEELEDWKSKQQEVFLVDLKRREINHLSRLTEEWTQRRTDLESALAHKLEQCSLLTSALEIANHNIQVRCFSLDRSLLNYKISLICVHRIAKRWNKNVNASFKSQKWNWNVRTLNNFDIYRKWPDAPKAMRNMRPSWPIYGSTLLTTDTPN